MKAAHMGSALEELRQWRAYCEQCTLLQLREVVRKERANGRPYTAAIAETVLGLRET